MPPAPTLLRWCGGIALALVVSVGPLARPAPGAPPPEVRPEVPVTGFDERLQLAHNSPLLVVDPDEERFVVLASRLDNPDFGCALQLSGDGGRTWLPVNPVPALPDGADKCYAPEAAFGPDGTLYYLFIALAGNGNSPSGTYLVTSKDRGRTFSEPRRVLGSERYMVRMALDRSAGDRGRIHLVWLQAGADPPLGGLAAVANPIMYAHSDDGGATFSEPVQVSDPARRRVVAPALALGPEGSIHVLHYDLQDDARDYQGLEGPTWEGTWSLVLATSTDGGATWASTEVDGELVPPERVMLIYTMPPAALAVDGRSRIFVAWHDARAGDWDVFLRRSTDGGRTWEGLRRLNDDPAGNGRHQYMPRLSTTAEGRLDAIFYDRRADPANMRYDVFLTSSSDGGRSFRPNLRLTSETSSSQIGTRYPIPSATGLVEFGSRIALFSLPTKTLAAWTDTRLQEEGNYSQDIFATEVDLTGGAPTSGGSADREDDGGGQPWLVGTGAVLAAAAVAGWARSRRKHSTAEPAATGEEGEPT